jgi:DNA-binding response OmpR family regulator
MTNKRILILDDNEAILDVVTEALRYENFEVFDISFGYQLMEAISQFIPDIILLDYRLADANGGDLCKLLKSDQEHQHIPLIIFSAYFNPMNRIYPLSAMGCYTNLSILNSY